MEVYAESFWTPKEESGPSGYEDAFYPPAAISSRGESFRFAMADGVTNSFRPAAWAGQVVECFVEGSYGVDELPALLTASQARLGPAVAPKDLPWWMDEKVELGAFCTFLGLILSEGPVVGTPGRWAALAVGDTCLVQVRGEKATAKFPVDRSERFDAEPAVLPSNRLYNAAACARATTLGGDLQLHDAFYLMTDAMAQWFLREDEGGRQPWLALRDLNTKDQRESFAEMVARLRSGREIRDDDCTLTRVEVLSV